MRKSAYHPQTGNRSLAVAALQRFLSHDRKGVVYANFRNLVLGAMDNFYGRSVFFVKKAEDALAFYTQKLGFTLDWNHQVEGRAFVFQVSLYGFELILNQIEDWTKDRAGHGRAFIGLGDDQVAPLREHISRSGITATVFHWGRPTLVIKDLDGNELFFWLPQSEEENLEALPPLNADAETESASV